MSIGDSMLGSRIDAVHLSVITQDKTNALLVHPATGPAWWFLALKNYLVASGEKPDFTFVFDRDFQLFRETNSRYLLRFLTLSPFAMTRADVQAGAYLLLLTVMYSAPIFVHDWAAAWKGDAYSVARLDAVHVHGSAAVAETLWQGALCGAMQAIILVLRNRTSLDFIYFQF